MLTFIIITLLLAGGAAIMTGIAIASTWRPPWQIVLYGLLLGSADRFIKYALFQEALLSLQGFLIDSLVLITLSFIAFRLKRVQQMIIQYPWLYARDGLISWKKLTK